MVVDLPAPFGPSSPTHVPNGTSRSSPSTAVIGPKRFTKPRRLMAEGAGVAIVETVGPARAAIVIAHEAPARVTDGITEREGARLPGPLYVRYWGGRLAVCGRATGRGADRVPAETVRRD